ncbi:MAG: alpha/beta hydrolase [Phycisphaeraceae bacterium]
MRNHADAAGTSSAHQDAAREHAPRASWLATTIARWTLRWSLFPGRQIIGLRQRRKARRWGGRPFRVPAGGGIELEAWFSPAARGKPARLPIVMAHGWIEVKECHFRRARWLNERGHDVILFDHRAHGQSGGRYATFGVREREDLAAVVAEARRRGLIGPDQRYISFGYSMGASTVLQHAPHDPQVAGVVAMAPFVDFREAVRSFKQMIAPWISDNWLLCGFERAIGEAGFEWEETSVRDALARTSVPVLMIEAGCDVNLPPEQHTRELMAIDRVGPLEVVSICDADHCTLTRKTWRQLNRAVGRFCQSLS